MHRTHAPVTSRCSRAAAEPNGSVSHGYSSAVHMAHSGADVTHRDGTRFPESLLSCRPWEPLSWAGGQSEHACAPCHRLHGFLGSHVIPFGGNRLHLGSPRLSRRRAQGGEERRLIGSQDSLVWGDGGGRGPLGRGCVQAQLLPDFLLSWLLLQAGGSSASPSGPD